MSQVLSTPPSVPRIPIDESERLLDLHRLGILDTPPSESFDRITRLAAEAMRVPILLVSLVDANRQWFKSCIGLDVSETSREVSFCGHVVFERKPLVINDATADPRFAANPLVVGKPHIRAYLGIPLFTLQGQPIGTLCAIDVQPRQFTDRELDTMSQFAKIVEELIHVREQSSRVRMEVALLTEREHLFRNTFNRSAMGIVHTALDGRLIRVNPRASEMLGHSEASLNGKHFVDITHEDDIPRNTQLFQQLKAGEIDRYHLEKRFIRQDGTAIWVSMSVTLAQDSVSQSKYLIAVMEDVSERKMAEMELTRARDLLLVEVERQAKQLRERNKLLLAQVKKSLEFERAQHRSERRTRAIADSVPAMIGYWNRDLRCEFANAAYRDWFGVDPAKAIGMTMQELIGDTLFRSNEHHVQLVLEGHEQRFERSLRKVDGTDSITEVRYIPDSDEFGGIRGFYVYTADITSLRAALADLGTLNTKLLTDSTTDYLTGIANRRVFTQRCEDAAQNCVATEDSYGLILIDLDNFKRINDAHGHDVGDDVLRAVGKVLREQLRERKDIAARLGGEEFAVLCFGELTADSLIQVAERIRSKVNSETIPSLKGPVTVTCSFGLALGQPHDEGWKSIYARADEALYEAKALGKNQAVFGHADYEGSGEGLGSRTAMTG